MKKFGFFVTAVSAVMLTTAATHAALISLYQFDGDYTQSIVDGGPTGTAGSAASLVSGGINGTGALSLVGGDTNVNSYVDITGARPLGADLASGVLTVSYWFNTNLAQANGIAMQQTTGTQVLKISTWNPGELYAGMRAETGTGHSVNGVTVANTSIYNSQWHQVVSTWDNFNADDDQKVKIYLDGQLQTLRTGDTRNITSDDGFVDPLKYIIGGELNSPTHNPEWCYTGMLDDYAAFDSLFDDTKALAMYNMGKTGSALGVGTLDADALFGLYDDAAHTPVTVKGMTWSYVASGLSGALGDVGSNYVVLGADGAGVQSATAVDVVWTGTSGTAWSNTANWNPGSTSNGVKNTFDDTATGLTANIASAATPTSVVFNNSSKNFTITGTSGIGGTATVLKQGTGTVTMSSVNTYSGVTTVEAGKLILSGAAKAMVPVLNNGGANIKGGMLVLDYATEADPVATVKGLLTTSYAAGAWNTGKFQSSTASASRGLGWTDNTGTSKINIAYTVYGDTNLDGTTNFTDLSKLLSKYGQSGVWADGDANYDGTVNFTDLSKMLSTYGQSVGSLTPSPEPSSIALLLTLAGLVGAWVIRRRG